MSERYKVIANPNGSPNYAIWDTVKDCLADEMLFASEVYANQTADHMNRKADNNG